MKPIDGILIALRLIYANKLRTLLNILGIMLGTASVISIICLSDSGAASVMSKFDKAGMDCVTVKSSSFPLTPEDCTFLKSVTENSVVVPVYMNYARIETENISRNVVLWGVAPGFEKIFDAELECGRYFYDLDIKKQRSIGIADYGIAQNFGNTVKLTLKNKSAVVELVGTLKDSKDDFTMFSDAVPMFIYMPYTTVMKLFGANSLDYISLKPETEKSLVAEGLRAMRRLERRSGFLGKYFVQNMADQKALLESVLSLIRLVLGCIAAVSLAVGTIGIINVMLIAVSERTAETGMMKAIGARKKDILILFLAEAAVITLIGALSGGIFGIALSGILSHFCGFAAVYDIKKILLIIFAISSAGIIFGIYPAKIAAGLDPAEALR